VEWVVIGVALGEFAFLVGEAGPPLGHVAAGHDLDTWVEPRMVGEVAYRTVSPDGRLRHPNWRGLRPDRRTGEVRLRTHRPSWRARAIRGRGCEG
jgi:ATP-dependent DNA ligase